MNGEVRVASSAVQNGDVQGVKKPKKEIKEHFDEPPLLQAVCTYICYGLLIIVGHISDFLRKIGLKNSGPTGKLKDVSEIVYPCKYFTLFCAVKVVFLHVFMIDGRGHANCQLVQPSGVHVVQSLNAFYRFPSTCKMETCA